MDTSEKDYIPKILESLGWPTDDTFLPVANDENRRLIDEISKLTEEKFKKAKELENQKKRVSTINGHLQNSKEEIEQNLKLIYAHRDECESEQHFLKVSKHNENQLIQQIRDIEKSESDLKSYQEKTQLEIDKIHQNLGTLSEKIQWAQGAIDEFRMVMEQGEAMNLLIEKYCKKDEFSAKLLESKRKLVQDQINKQKTQLINAYEEQKSLEQVLERTAQLYRQAHVERRQMVATWKDAVNQMNQREHNIEQAEKDLENAIELSNLKNSELKEQIQFLEQQIQNNRDTELSISELNNQFSKLKSRMTDLEEMSTLKTNELAILKKTLHNTATLLNNQRQKNKQSAIDKDNKIAYYEKEVLNYESLLKKEKNFMNRNISAQDRLKEIDEIIEGEEKIIKSLQLEITRLGGALYRSQIQLKTLQDEEKLLMVEGEATKANIQTVRNGFKHQEKELLRQTEIIYNVDFTIQNLERRLNNMKGTGTEKNDDRDRKIAMLQDLHVRKTTDYNLIFSQVAKVEHDMKQMTLSYTQDNIEYENLLSRLKERQLHAEGGEKEILRQTTANQERLVDQSILKMKVNQLEKEIQKQENKKYNLDRHKLSLEIAMKERLIAIKAEKELLLLSRKNMNDEISQYRADIGERNIKIDVLRKRYECAIELLGKNEDGSMITATQIKIQNAQEKYMLLKDGNELNEKVLQAEEDIKAMENTLRLMNYSNDNYRKKFENIEDENPLGQELNEAQEIYCKMARKSKMTKCCILVKDKELEDLKVQSEELDKVYEDISRERLDKNDIIIKIHKELLDQKVKMQRAERELKAAIKICKEKIKDSEFLSMYAKDLKVKELEARNSSALQQLADLVENNLEIGPAIAKSLFEKGLTMPHPPRTKSQTSWKSNASLHSVGSEFSIQPLSASSKGSSSSNGSSKASLKSGLSPSIVMLGFPGASSSSQKTNRFKKY